MTNLKTFCKDTELRLLIDADMFIYKAAVVSEEETHWGNDVWSLHSDLHKARKLISTQVKNAKSRLDIDKVVMCISDKENFRREVHKDYKSNRKGSRKPVGYKSLVQWVRSVYDSLTVPTLEADDVMGILATAPKSRSIIVSDDKDMKTIPGKLFRPMNNELLDISDEEALKSFFTQALIGDPVDGYKGCPRVGQITAEKILGNRPEWSQVAAAYANADISEKDAIVQARLARILHYKDYNFRSKKPKLWKPKKR